MSRINIGKSALRLFKPRNEAYIYPNDDIKDLREWMEECERLNKKKGPEGPKD